MLFSGAFLRKPLVATLLAAAAAAGSVMLAVAQTPLLGQLVRYLERNWIVVILLAALGLIVLFSILALVYGMRREGGREIYRNFRRLIR